MIANPVGINIPHKCGMVSSTHMWRNIENQTGRVGIRTNVLWWQVWVAGGVTTELSIPRIKNDKFNFFLEIFLKCWCANPVDIKISHKCRMVSSMHLWRDFDTKQAEPGFEPTSYGDKSELPATLPLSYPFHVLKTINLIFFLKFF